MGKEFVIAAILFSIFVQTYSQGTGAIDRAGLENLLSKETDTVYVINFWATWCSPCVKEIEYFEELHKSVADRKLQVVLINLDFPDKVEKRVKPFIVEKGLTAPVLNMQDINYNNWIPLVDSIWSGAIPATLIFRKDKRKFIAGELNRDELFDEVDRFYNHQIKKL